MNDPFRTFADVVTYMENIPMFSRDGKRAARFEPDRMERFLQRMDNPHRRIRTIHVAGTNGKGTTCRMLASLFQEAGYRTGLYTSPHLRRFNERIRIDAIEITDTDIHRFFLQFGEDLLENPLTYFELSTAIAFWYFAEMECEIVVLETGLGGRLDATNVVDPLVSVITSVSTDHTDILGEFISAIAKEKAGIIKPGRPVVAGPLPDDAWAAVINRAHDTGSDIFFASRCQPVWHGDRIALIRSDGSVTELPASGLKPVDRHNAAITLVVAELLEAEFPGLSDSLPGAFERLPLRFPESAVFQRLIPGRDWYFDGAHNRAAVESLMEMIREIAAGREPVLFLSLMSDKVTPELLDSFQRFRRIYYLEGKSTRSAKYGDVAGVLPGVIPLQADDPEVNSLLDDLKTELVIFTGSFYFYDQVQHWIASQPPSDRTENPHSGH